MSVSFKRPPHPLIVQRDGTVKRRADDEVLGRVRQDRTGRWHHSGASDRVFGYATRADAADALAREYARWEPTPESGGSES